MNLCQRLQALKGGNLSFLVGMISSSHNALAYSLSTPTKSLIQVPQMTWQECAPSSSHAFHLLVEVFKLLMVPSPRELGKDPSMSCLTYLCMFHSSHLILSLMSFVKTHNCCVTFFFPHLIVWFRIWGQGKWLVIAWEQWSSCFGAHK